MMKTLRAAACGLLVTALAASASAQVVPVNNTGCPGFAPPTWSGSHRLGQTLTFDLLGRPAPRSFTFLAMGYQSGNTIPFFQPFTCAAGPCGWYPAPFGSAFIAVSDPFHAVLALPIPNDRRLMFQTFSVQGGFVSGFGNCVDFSQAVSFAIAP